MRRKALKSFDLFQQTEQGFMSQQKYSQCCLQKQQRLNKISNTLQLATAFPQDMSPTKRVFGRFLRFFYNFKRISLVAYLQK